MRVALAQHARGPCMSIRSLRLVRSRHTRHCLVVLVLVLGTVGAVRAGRELTAERLQQADREADNWLVYGRTYRSLRYSPLDQINQKNVRTLQAAWACP